MTTKFGNLMKEYREAKSLSQKKAAELCSISEGSYKQYEYGYRLPKLENKVKIIHGLEIPLEKAYEVMKYYEYEPEYEPAVIERSPYAPKFPEALFKNLFKGLEEIPPAELDSIIWPPSNWHEAIDIDLKKLNNHGKGEAMKRIHEMTYVPEYTDPNYDLQENIPEEFRKNDFLQYPEEGENK